MINTNGTKLRRFFISGLIFGSACLTPAFAAEDEWYDPTDWFDGNNIESDDTYDGIYDYSYDYDHGTDWNAHDTWGDDVWEDGYYDSEYWDNYNWSRDTNTATSSAGTGRGDAQPQDAMVYSYVLVLEPISTDQQQARQGQQSQQQQQKGQMAQQDRQGLQTQANQPSGQNQQSRQRQQAQAKQQSGQDQQAQWGGQGQRRSSQMAQSSGQKESRRISRLTGTIEGLRQMNLQRQSGATGEHMVAKIKLQNGRSTIISLGRSSQVQDANLKVGDTIEAIGRRGMIDGETVFVAHSIKANNQTIAANPVIRLRQNAQAQRPGGQQKAGEMTGSGTARQVTLSGDVARIRRMNVGQSDNQHTMLNLRLEDGRTATVDLGPGTSLEKIDLQEGDHITVRGRTKQVNGRRVISVDLMRIDGEQVSSVSRDNRN